MSQTQTNHHMHVVLTSPQYEMLSRKARACGLSKRAFLVRLVEGAPVRTRPSQELRELRVELNRIGVNLNQIARKANAGLAKKEEIEEVLHMMAEVRKLVEERVS